MAFTLKIEAKTLFGNKSVDFKRLIQNCGLQFGHNNDFYILEDGAENNTVILYNPKRIGRGIFFDGRKMSEGKVEISYNIPTTEAEITDFIRVVKELESQLKKVEMYCVEEECESIFPVKADGFLNLERMAINEGYVRYFIFSEDRLMDGLYDYDKFVQYMLEHGATYYDRSHILVPSMTKAQIEEMARVTGV